MAKFQIYKAANGEFRWRFRADNGEIIAIASEGYSRKADCAHAVDLIKQKGPAATVEEEAPKAKAAAKPAAAKPKVVAKPKAAAKKK
jgi:uncharacterized protein YegP (UPF0339 family)